MSPNSENCEAKLTYVLDPDVGPEHLKCDLPSGHDGQHMDGTTTWGPARILRDDPTAPELARLQARLAEEVAVSGLLACRAEASEGEHGVTREREAEQRRRAELAEQASAEWQAACEAHAADSERLADGVLALEAERDALKAALLHHAAEAHRRKWAHEHSNPAAFDVLHQLGNELRSALYTP
jgi:hypothetical protein